MAKLQGFKRIVMEDYDQQYRSLIQKLGYSINNFAKNVVDTLNNNQVTIADNLNIKELDISVKVDGSGVPIGGLSVKTGLDHSCRGISVILISNITNSVTIPTGVPYVSFSEKSGIITISNITNLVANDSYTLRMILF